MCSRDRIEVINVIEGTLRSSDRACGMSEGCREGQDRQRVCQEPTHVPAPCKVNLSGRTSSTRATMSHRKSCRGVRGSAEEVVQAP